LSFQPGQEASAGGGLPGAGRQRAAQGNAAPSVSFNTRRSESPKIGIMRIGIGLPAAVPGADMAQIGSFAAQAEQAGFESVGVIDRLVYDNLDPLVALAAAAARTSRVALISTVVNVNWRPIRACWPSRSPRWCGCQAEGSRPAWVWAGGRPTTKRAIFRRTGRVNVLPPR
jgi:hypothetical protein